MRKCKLSECVKEINDRTTENNQYEVLTSSKNGIFSQEEYFDKQVASKDNTGYKIIKNGQFTYRSMSDSGTFTINRLEDKEIGIVSPAYPVFEATNVDAEFLKYYFRSELFNKTIINLSQGSTRTALKFKDLINIEIYLPEIEEQKRIVKILKNNDQVIEKYDELIKEKEQFIKSQFVEMFEQRLYKDVLLGEEFIINSGGTPDKRIKEYWEPREISWIGSNLCRDKVLYENDGKYISTEGLKHSSAKIFKSDTVLVALVGATIGKTALLKFETTTNQNIAGIECNDSFNSEYVFYAIQNLYNDFVKLNVGNFKMANLSFIRNLRIKKPPIELQNKFANFVKLIDKQKFELEKQKQNYIDLKKGLMQQLLTGKLKVS
ncbi:MAG: restriction endonuclease subunit S [Clostridia bacterium]|nr:restriction endonuclease subunit S [Clostridia bacterium]